ncbi:hypothetical protein DXG01_013815 [Tephrocybe rancida]|nr:hypothetical protein DXG01_013815 [Tephrocybe rancida]
MKALYYPPPPGPPPANHAPYATDVPRLYQQATTGAPNSSRVPSNNNLNSEDPENSGDRACAKFEDPAVKLAYKQSGDHIRSPPFELKDTVSNRQYLSKRFEKCKAAKEKGEEAKETATAKDMDRFSRRTLKVTRTQQMSVPSEAEAQRAELARGKINLQAALDSLEMNMGQFIDSCLLLGSDYLELMGSST